MSIPRKKKICKGCNTEQFIFSGGKCKSCQPPPKPLNRTPLKPSPTKIKKQTAKNVQKRKTERAGFGEFFQKHLQIIIDERRCCENCHTRLQGAVFEIAHVFSKNQNYHPEVATNDLNVIYLCLDCHTAFDSSLSKREMMPVFSVAAKKVEPLLDILVKYSKEKQQVINYLQKILNNFTESFGGLKK